MRKLRELARDEFLERAENALAFGLPGVRKSHAVFSHWEKIFKNPMATAAAIRLARPPRGITDHARQAE
jgi:hypothetical protein